MVSIIPRGMAGGFTMSLPMTETSYSTKRHMSEELVVLLGGRMAEKLVLDDISTGASNDLERVSKIARNMVTRYGFSDKLGPVVYGQNQDEVFLGRDISMSRNYSENIAADIDLEIRALVDEAYESAEKILTDHMDQLHLVAHYVFHHEKIDGETFRKLMEGELSLSGEETPMPGDAVKTPEAEAETAEAVEEIPAEEAAAELEKTEE